MSIAQALLVPGAMAFLVALLMLGSWLEVRLAKAELKLVPVKAGNDAGAAGSATATRSAA
jgi:hypothetical protein